MAKKIGETRSREFLALTVLLAVFLACAFYYNRIGQEVTDRNEASSLNARGPGAKALSLLLEKEGYPVDRLEAPWTALSSHAGLLIVIEPLEKDRMGGFLTEIKALHDWVQQGGSVLYIVTNPPRPLDANDTVAGDIAVMPGDAAPREVAPTSRSSIYTRDVTGARFQTPVRLQPGPGSAYDTLFSDEQGRLAVQKRLGAGHVIIVANSFGASNAGASAADNAVFLVDVAAASVDRSGRTILFDEYHHGHGFEADTPETSADIADRLPLPLKLAMAHGLVLFALLLYNGNTRFGRATPLADATNRPSTDYISSMARLYRRSGGSDIALIALYTAFMRDLRGALDAPPESGLAEIAPLAAKVYRVDPANLMQTLSRYEEIAGGQRITEAEMLRLSQQLGQLRREFRLVGSEQR